MIKQLIYHRITTFFLKLFCSLFYNPKYLKGKFFEKHRMGYWWAIRAIPRLYFLHRQNVNWPVGKNTMILGGDKILFHINSINVFQQPWCYFQAFATINIGNNVWIGQNTGIITANHNLLDPEQHEIGKPVYIGDNTWIGMNSVILPGVSLGPNTIVGAGSVVTKSFPAGHCVIAGNPAKLLKIIE